MRPRLFLAALFSTAVAHAADAPPPPAVTTRIDESVALPSPKAREPEPEVDAVKVRLNGEYEARQSFLTALPVAATGAGATGRESLGQTSRLYHWLRLRGLVLAGTHWEVRLEADAPHGMLYGQELDNIAYSGSDFERIQPFRMQPRMLKLTWRSPLGEISLGHTTTQLGMGLIDADGDQPRYFGGRQFAASYERLQLLSGTADSTLRVGAAGDVLFDDGRLSLTHDDRLLRVGLSARYAPSRGSHLNLLARYESLGKNSDRAGAQVFVLDLSGSFRRKIRGHSGEVFADYEAAYRIGTVNEPTDFATGSEQTLTAAAFALRGGVALEREHAYRRYAHFVASLEWGLASGDADPTDDELHRFVMNPNHGVGLLLFNEVLRFKTARAEASLENTRGSDAARLEGLPTRGGVAGASYLNPVLLYRPDPDLTLKLGAVVATATSAVVDPSKLAATGERANFDGGSPFGRSLGSELDFGAELSLPLSPPSALRLSVEGAVAFPGSAFDDAGGHGLGTQAMTTLGAGVTF